MNEREFETLVAYRRHLDAIAAEPGPAARILASPSGRVPATRSIAVLPGAFNPPTRAHLALAEAARSAAFDEVFLSLGRVTLDKSDSGLMLEDRLSLLCVLAAQQPHLGVLIHNRGLYAEIAEAIDRSLPGLERIAFVVGMDKVPQLFDARYYDDLEKSLESLFPRARILVAPRGPHDRQRLDQILSSEPARRFAQHFDWLSFPEEWRHVSATAVREGWVRGSLAAQHLPIEVAEFLDRTGAFSADGRYALRRERFEQTLRVKD